MAVQLEKIRTWCIALLLFCIPIGAQLYSQDYKYEVGGTIGTSFYLGDANRTKAFHHSYAAGGVLYRYNLNLQWVLKTNILCGSVSGNTADSGNQFPGGQQTLFQRTLMDVGSQMEFNFFRFSNDYEYLGAKPYTPYLFIGAGITLATGRNTFFGVNLPFGFGFKYKFNNRMNMGAEASLRKLFRDDFDAPEDASGWSLDTPFGISGSPLKNQDWYSFALIYITWDFGSRNDPCR